MSERVPAVLGYMAAQCIHTLRQHHPIADEDMTAEITFTRDALSRIGSERPDVLRLTRLCGVEVSFPERESPTADWSITVVDQRSGLLEVGCTMVGTTDVLLYSP